MAVGFRSGWRVPPQVRSDTSSLACDAHCSSRSRAMTLYPGSMLRSGGRLLPRIVCAAPDGVSLPLRRRWAAAAHQERGRAAVRQRDAAADAAARALRSDAPRRREPARSPRGGGRAKPTRSCAARFFATIRTFPPPTRADRNAQATTTERKLQITIDVDIIDQTTGRTLWSRKGMLEEGTYAERAEADGRRQALTKA